MQVYTFVWEFFIHPLCSLYLKAEEISLFLQHMKLAISDVFKLYCLPENPPNYCIVNKKCFYTLSISLTLPQPLELPSAPCSGSWDWHKVYFQWHYAYWCLSLVYPLPCCAIWFHNVKEKKPKLVQNSTNNFFMNHLLLFQTTVKSLLMILNLANSLF